MTKPTVLTMSVSAVLAACSPTTYVTRVTRQHRLTDRWRDRSFAVQPVSGTPDRDFDPLADTVSMHLQGYGLCPTYGTVNPEIIVTLGYGAQSVVMPPALWSRPRPSDMGDTGTPIFARWAEVVLREALHPTLVLFRGRAVSEGPSRNLAEVLPHVIGGLFQNFPGNTRESLTLLVPALPPSHTNGL